MSDSERDRALDAYIADADGSLDRPQGRRGIRSRPAPDDIRGRIPHIVALVVDQVKAAASRRDRQDQSTASAAAQEAGAASSLTQLPIQAQPSVSAITLERANTVADMTTAIENVLLTQVGSWQAPSQYPREPHDPPQVQRRRITAIEEVTLVSDPRLWTKDIMWADKPLTGNVISRICEGMANDVSRRVNDVGQKKELELMLDTFRHLLVSMTGTPDTFTTHSNKAVSEAMRTIYDRFRLLHSVEGVTGTARGAALTVGAARLRDAGDTTDDRYRHMSTAVRETAVLVGNGATRSHAHALSSLPGGAAIAQQRAGGARADGGGCGNCARTNHTTANCSAPGGAAYVARDGAGRGRGGARGRRTN